MLIFVHMLKAGGTSLRGLLEPLFGARLVRDYDDIPMSNRPEHGLQRAARRAALHADPLALDADLVFGHFIMDKYQGLRREPGSNPGPELGPDPRPGLRFGTMLRDPAARIVSHYFHYLRNIGGPRNELLPEGISLLEFARLPRYCDMYRYLLGRVSISALDYVGITESFAPSVALLARVLRLPEPEQARLVQTAVGTHLNRAGEYAEPIAYLRERGLLGDVIAAQRVNYEYYDAACERFAGLCARNDIDPGLAQWTDPRTLLAADSEATPSLRNP